MPLRQWLKSANFAIEGILHAAKTQRHLRYHFYASFLVIVASYVMGVTRTEFLLIVLTVITVLVAEMLNTAVEAAVDLISPEHHIKAKQAKDIAAGGVLITTMGAAAIGYIILFPYFKGFFDSGFFIAQHSGEEISIVAIILTLIATILLKAYMGKGKPLMGGAPSGHAAIAFSLWMSVTYTTGSFIASALCLVLAMLIAQSRITTKIHKPWEVVLGSMLGAGLTFILFKVFT